MRLLIVTEDLYELMPKSVTYMADRIILINSENEVKIIKDRYPERELTIDSPVI